MGKESESGTVTATAIAAKTGKQYTISLRQVAVAGTGSFGVVRECVVVGLVARERSIFHEGRSDVTEGGSCGVGSKVALKTTTQDKRFKNRELQLCQALDHPNIVKLLYYYYEPAPSTDHVLLNLVLELHKQTIYKLYRTYAKANRRLDEFSVKLYTWQVVRAVAYLHSRGVCHRDLKPHNIMVDPDTGVATLIDFGSAKVLAPPGSGQINVAYTCSRFYRAPELLFSATDYTTSIDIWSLGCIVAELLQGYVMFAGTSGIDQLVEIIKVLGTPTKEQICTMNPSYKEHRFPEIRKSELAKELRHSSQEAVSLLDEMLVYDPGRRPSAAQILANPWFDELRSGPNLRMPNGRPVPSLFDFTHHELSNFGRDLVWSIVPRFAESQIYERIGVDLSRPSWQPLDLSSFRLDPD